MPTATLERPTAENPAAESTQAEKQRKRRGREPGKYRKEDRLSAQVNVRLDPKIKAEADAAFAEAGINATEVIRAVYAKAAKRGQDLEELRDLLDNGRTPEEQKEFERKQTALEHSDSILSRALGKYDLQADFSGYVPPSDEELLAMMFEDWKRGEI